MSIRITADHGINVGTQEIPIFDVPIRINGQLVAMVGFLPVNHHNGGEIFGRTGAIYWKSIEFNSQFWRWKDQILMTAQKAFNGYF